MSTYVLIQGTFPLALGGAPMVGAITVSWPSFTDSSGGFHPSASQHVSVSANGAYSFHLAANQGATPAGSYYEVQYRLKSGSQLSVDYLIVPIATTALTIDQCRLNQAIPPPPFLIQPAQISSVTAHTGDILAFSAASNGYLPATFQSAFPFTFTAQTSVFIPQTAHAQGASLFVQVYDSTGAVIYPAVNADPITGNVTLSFGSSTTGSGWIYGGLARSLPNFSIGFFNASAASIPSVQHGFNSPNLAVAIYDPLGNLIGTGVTVQIDANFAVNVTLGYPQNFRVVIIGLVGSSQPSFPGPYTQTLSAVTSLSLPAATHGQGVYALPFVFTNDAPPQAADFEYTRALNGDLVLSFSPAFSGSLQVMGASAPSLPLPYTQTFTSVTSLSLTASIHGQGAYALPFVFTNDTPPQAAVFEYTRATNGDLVLSFSPALSGTLQVSGTWQ